jgi:hypothetical protein
MLSVSHLAQIHLKFEMLIKNGDSVEIIPGTGGRRVKESDGGGEFNYDIL